MNTMVELKKYLQNPITIVLLLISMGLFGAWIFQHITGYARAQNPLITEASQKATPLDEGHYNEAVDYVTEHLQDWVYLDLAGQNRYQYEQFYMNAYDKLYAYRLSIEAEKEAIQSVGFTPADRERFGLIEQRIQDLSFVRDYDSKRFLDAVMGKLWYADLLLMPLLFASIYSYDIYFISPILAAAPRSGALYLRAKAGASLLIGTILYWIPLLILLAFYTLKTNFLMELNLPYYYISPLTSWDMSIGNGLSFLVLSGFIQFLYLIIIFMLISQSTRFSLVSAVAGFLYSGGAIFLLTWLLPYFNHSEIAHWLITIWALTPAGALSYVVRHDYFYPDNFLGFLSFLKDYSLPLFTSTIFMIPLLCLLYHRRRSCFRDSGKHLRLRIWLKEAYMTFALTRHVSQGDDRKMI